MDTLQALAIAVLQGVTELFPVSSLGHAVIVPALLGWNIDQKAASFLPFLVVLHFGTGTALLAYFWRDWLDLFYGVAGRGESAKVAASRHLLLMMIVATIPAVILGFALEHFFRALFGSPQIAALFLTANGILLFVGERVRRMRPGHGDLPEVTWRGALAIGLWQSTALFPGISRSGATILGGLLAGMTHEASARFSFLIATPIIFAASVKEIPKLLHESAGLNATVWLAGAVAGVFAYLSTWFLMRYFKTHDATALDPFAYYCAIFGVIAFAVLRG